MNKKTEWSWTAIGRDAFGDPEAIKCRSLKDPSNQATIKDLAEAEATLRQVISTEGDYLRSYARSCADDKFPAGWVALVALGVWIALGLLGVA